MIVVIGDADAGHPAALGDRRGDRRGLDGQAVPDIVINDAMRRPPSPQLIESLPPTSGSGSGCWASWRSSPEDEPAGPFATNA